LHFALCEDVLTEQVDRWTGGGVDGDCDLRAPSDGPHAKPVTTSVTDNRPNTPNQQRLSRHFAVSGYSRKTQSVLEEYRRTSADS
jgi:hypothetical protein